MVYHIRKKKKKEMKNLDQGKIVEQCEGRARNTRAISSSTTINFDGLHQLKPSSITVEIENFNLTLHDL